MSECFVLPHESYNASLLEVGQRNLKRDALKVFYALMGSASAVSLLQQRLQFQIAGFFFFSLLPALREACDDLPTFRGACRRYESAHVQSVGPGSKTFRAHIMTQLC